MDRSVVEADASCKIDINESRKRCLWQLVAGTFKEQVDLDER